MATFDLRAIIAPRGYHARASLDSVVAPGLRTRLGVGTPTAAPHTEFPAFALGVLTAVWTVNAMPAAALGVVGFRAME